MTHKQWKNYFFSTDFSDVAGFLKDKEPGYIFTGEEASLLAAIFQEHDPRKSKRELWQNAGDHRDYSVRGAEVIYNGVNHRDKPTNAKFTHVMTLLFPEEQEAPKGRIHVQYNLPEGA